MADDADQLVARAIESVLDQVPGAIDTSVPEAGAAKLQPWAETAAPAGRNKRPLEELLAELAERVAADPDARVTLPRTRHPALAFFDRFGRTGRGQTAGSAAPPEGGGRRRRRRRGGGGQASASPEVAAETVSRQPAQPASGGGRRRRRGRGGGGGTPSGEPSGSAPTAAATPGQQRSPGSGGGRRRRGRRGRGGAGPPSAPG